MPRFAFATPFLPEKQDVWRARSAQIPTRRVIEHRAYLLDRGIYRERWWMQTGQGSPALSLTLWDCDDIDRVTEHRDSITDHEGWMATAILGDVQGIEPGSYETPRPEVLSGTTTMATATAESQTMFALPLPPEGVPAVRELIERIEQGDLAQAHGRFLAESSIREEWIWLQAPVNGLPPLLLVQWIGDHIEDAWTRLTNDGGDDYARVMREALFRRLIGISPSQVAQWQIEQLLVMHVRRSDAYDGSRRRLAQRLFRGMAEDRWELVARMLDDDVVLTGVGDDLAGRGPVAAQLQSFLADADGTTGEPADLLVGDRSVIALMVRSGRTQPVLIEAPERRVTRVRMLPDYQG